MLFQQTGQLDLIKMCSYYVNLAQKRYRRQVAVLSEKSTLSARRLRYRGADETVPITVLSVLWSLMYGVSYSSDICYRSYVT